MEAHVRQPREHNRSAIKGGIPLQLRTHANFVEAFQVFRRCTLYGVIGATIASVGIMVALIPVAPEFRYFFRNRIGGNWGEGLLGAFFPLAASPPAILFFVWIHKRTKQLELRCNQCNHLFNTYSVFERVRDSGLCPACGTQQFCDADQFCQSTFVARTGPSPQQSLQAALVCALLLLSFGALLIVSWFFGSGVQWLAAGIVTMLAGLWYLIRRSRFRSRHIKTTIAEQGAEPELPITGF